MKGVILAGGHGTRLYPCTKVVNKHLLPIYDQPMIFYAMDTLIRAGVTEVMLITNPEYGSDFMRLFGSNYDGRLTSMTYGCQDVPGGIAQALSLAKSWTGDEKFVVVLGDNLIFDNFREDFVEFVQSDFRAQIFVKEVPNPESFGVAVFDDGKIVDLVEKPKEFISNSAVVGVYFYDSSVYDIIATLTPSARGEYEITDVNKRYLQMGKLTHGRITHEWLDTGTHASLRLASDIIASMSTSSAGSSE